MTGENYGQNVNNTTVVRKTRKDGSSGLINLPRSTAEIRMFRKDLESRYGKGEQKKQVKERAYLNLRRVLRNVKLIECITTKQVVPNLNLKKTPL